MLNIGLLSFFDEDEGGKYTIASLRIAASLLDMDNVSVEIIPIPINICDEHLLSEIDKINNSDFEVIGMSAYVWTWEKIRKISLGLNRDKIKAVLVGGPEIQNSIRSDWYGDELFSYGEGEMFTREICKLLIEGANIQDIHQMQRIANAEKKDDIYIIEKDGELYNSIPIYTFDNLKKLKIEDFCTDYCFYETTRGCPYKCGYCGHKFRQIPVTFDKSILENEIRFFGEVGLKRIFIVDPIPGGTPKRGKEILSMFNKYAPNTKITSFLRPEYLDDEYLELLSRSSIEELRFGIQTINESVPNWIRANNISKILKILPLLTSTGIPWRAELIGGLPGDDIYGLKRSIEFVIKEVHPTYLHAYHLSVLKETEMYSLLNNPGDKWIKIYEDTMRAKESYSYSEKELIWMVQYAVLITALYNMYASVDEITGKAINEAPEFAELEKTVMEHMGEFVSKGLIHYSDGEKYWAKVKSSDN